MSQSPPLLSISHVLAHRAALGISKPLTLVMSVVCRSISRSSAVLSVKPGSTCLACSLSKAATTPNSSQHSVYQLPNGHADYDSLFALPLLSISSTSSLRSTHFGGSPLEAC